ncbi:hypothetical protein DIPPA_61635 [Diplonema papillatum]|nr:hypothetical protein DIPPA_61635 [Diplonema papillatum]|eukprot:gene194-312_t
MKRCLARFAKRAVAERPAVEDESRKVRVVEKLSRGLNEKQRSAFATAGSGEHLLLMGAAGTGKSHATRVIRHERIFAGQSVAICAPFGVAACNVSGYTMHSTFALDSRPLDIMRNTLPDSKLYKDARNMLVKRSLKQRKQLWKQIDTLLIDEISTCDATTFDLLDFMARTIKQRDVPFGGVQVIAVGDFLQLPPVEGDWVFKSEKFRELFNSGNTVQLDDVLRQNDTEFLETLNFIRTLHPDHALGRELAKQLIHKTCVTGKEAPADAVKLVPLRNMAVSWNKKCLAALPTEPQAFHAYDSSPRLDPELSSAGGGARLKKSDMPALDQRLTKLLQHSRFDAEVCIKKGARVMHLQNTHRSFGKNASSVEAIVNGHTGVVTGFDVPPEAQRSQDYENWAELRRSEKLGTEVPIVRWDHSRCSSFVLPVMSNVGDAWLTLGYVKDRIQLPLALAWAITAHKCQGMTLPGNVSVSINRTFAHGQAYVALSRSQSGEKTFVSGVDDVTRDGFSADVDALEYLGITH